jgi:hypothetical protein
MREQHPVKMKKSITHKPKSKRYKVKRWKQKHKVGRKNYGVLKLGKNIPAQLHAGKLKSPIKSRLELIEEIPKESKRTTRLDHSNKPGKALWTSTYTPKSEEDTESDWVRWAAGEQFAQYKEGQLLRPLKTAKVFKIDSAKDIRNLYETYGFFDRGMPRINWDKVAEDYDGVSASERAVHKFHINEVDVTDITKRKFPEGYQQWKQIWNKGSAKEEEPPIHLDLNPWDAESTAWFKDVFRKRTPVKIKTKMWTDDYYE